MPKMKNLVSKCHMQFLAPDRFRTLKIYRYPSEKKYKAVSDKENEE